MNSFVGEEMSYQNQTKINFAFTKLQFYIFK